MKTLAMILSVCAVLSSPACNNSAKNAASSQPDSEARRIVIFDAEGDKLIDSSAEIEVIASGFKWTEGPLYIADGDYLLFSDIPNNRIYKWKEGQDTSVYLEPSGNTNNTELKKEPGSNGLLLDPDGNLVLCQHGDRCMGKMTAPLNAPKPEFIKLADRFQGKRLNSPNDAVYHPNGDLYFTDPPYGLDKVADDPAKELDFQGVYRLKPNGQLDLVSKELKYPNGIALSPDSKTLYVGSSDAANMLWMQYELDGGGLVKSSRVFHEAHAYEGKQQGSPDGMKVDKQGNVFASGPEGIWIISPQGKLLAKLYTGQLTSNCAFSADQQTLYMTCDDYVMRVKLKKG